MMKRENIRLEIRQQPKRAQVVQESNVRNRKPIDPPPIIELHYNDAGDSHRQGQWLVSPRTFMVVTSIDEKDPNPTEDLKHLVGQTVSSLHKLRDSANAKEGGYFVFGDLSARKVGKYRLRFALYDFNRETDEIEFFGSVDSDVFQVMAQRDFGSMSESTVLTRQFSDQGVKLRVRKESRAMSTAGSKRGYNNHSPQSVTPPSHTLPFHTLPHDQSPTIIKRQRIDSDFGTMSMPMPGLASTTTTAVDPSVSLYGRHPSNEWQYSWSSNNSQSNTAGINYARQPIALPSTNQAWSNQQQSPFYGFDEPLVSTGAYSTSTHDTDDQTPWTSLQ